MLRRMGMRKAAMSVLVLALAACTVNPSDPAGPAASSLSGPKPPACADVVQPGLPVTERLLSDGCSEADGTVTTLTPFLCRFVGYTALNYNDQVVAIELALGADEPRPSVGPDHSYGMWRAPLPDGSGADATGCIDPDAVPDPVAEPSG